MEKTNYINYKELMPYITEDVIIDILAENGSPVYGEGQTSEGQKYLIFRTVCHHGDSHKLYYYEKSLLLYRNRLFHSIMHSIKNTLNNRIFKDFLIHNVTSILQLLHLQKC